MSEFITIGLLGQAGSGKDLVADWFQDNASFAKVSFSDPMKRFARATFDLSEDQLWGSSDMRNEIIEIDESWWLDAIARIGDASEEIIQDVLDVGLRTDGYLSLHSWISNLRREYPTKISARVILQTLGTEWGRNLNPEMWVNYGHKTARDLQAQGMMYSPTSGVHGPKMSAHTLRGVVIPDHRFANEVAFTKAQGGFILRIKRLSQEVSDVSVGVAGHASEREQKSIPDELFDRVMRFEEGIDSVYAALRDLYREKPWSKASTLS